MPPHLLAALLLTAGLLAGCSGGTDCDALPTLTEQRDAARADYDALVARQAGDPAVSDADVDAQHDAMHDLDERTFDLRRACEGS